MTGMKILFRTAVLGVLATAFLGGCSSAQKDELAMLKEENAQLTMQRDEARSALDSSEAERRRLEQENAQLASRANEMPPAAASMPTMADSGTANLDLPAGVTAENRNGTLVLTIEGDVLFDSGKASLKGDARKTLDKVSSEIRKKFPENQLRLVGFTDTDPIRRSGFKTNYHLGFERAFSVGQYLENKGIEKTRIEYATWGPEFPKKSKRESRRVEIAVVNNDVGGTD